MNKVHRIIWNEALQMWMAVAENAKGHSKSSRSVASAKRRLKLAALAAALVTGSAGLQIAYAGPAGGQVTSGVGSIGQNGNITTINQSSQNLSLNWKSFNVASHETVNFVQPSATAIAVNKIFDTNGSQILGNLNANGQVFLINPNGVIFGSGAQVNVGGLVASTLDISSSNANTTSFAGNNNSTGSVVNLGKITAANGGYVALLGNHVSNQGVISAQLGTVALGAGSAITLSFNGSNLVRMVVDQSVLNTLADNGGLIQADGGKVLMTAGAAKSLLASVVNNTGVIEARTVNQQGGTITLLGGMQNGTVNVAGTLDASAPSALNGQGGNGGFIETSAANVQVANGAKVTTAAAMGLAGTWLIDPTDFTISAGTDGLSTSGIGASTLGTSLGSTNVSIATSATAHGSDLGDINVNAPVTWSANQLTLTAHNNININANLNGSGTASLALQYGQGAVAAGNTSTYNLNNGAQVNLPAGPNFSTLLGSDGAIKNYTVITSLGAANSTTTTDLQGISGGLSGNYVLGGNIDATSTASWNTGAGFTPIGDQSTAFSGQFDGLGHTISNVTINLPEQFSVGLFGRSTGLIQNVGMVGGSVTGAQYVGSLVGFLLSANGVLNNTYATGNVTGGRWTGGLIGASMGAISISNSYATGNVYGGANGLQIGGLFGQLSGSLTNSYATGNVTAGAQVGGLGGKNYGGTITNSYATGNVTGGTLSTQVGGLVGYNYGGSISNSYATGRVTGGSQVGGLVGWGTNVSSISNSYATGSVTGTTGAGGLVGENSNSTITNSYATGNVTGDTNVGGLVGYNYGFYKLSTSHATGSVSGSTRVGGLVGWNYGWVDNSYATGNVTGSTLYAGGLTGFNQRMIDNSYATGNVAGVSSVGGLAGGTEYGTPTNNYSTGIVSGSSHVGGLVGILLNGATLTHNYWNTTNNPTLPGVADVGTGSGAGATGLTTQQMQTASNFVGFNFTGTPGAVGNNWVIVNTDGTLNNAGGATGATSPMLATEYSTTINNAHQLQLMAMDPAASYTLGANINAAATAGGDVWGRVSAGFTPTFAPVGKETTPFSGSFDGLGHTISGLTINLPSQDQVGLFGRTSASAVIQNVGLVGGSVSGRSYVGVLVGDNYGGTISNSYSTGTVTGSDLVGGIVGANYGTISNSYATGSVNGRGYVGGLVGLNNYGTINNSYTTGSVTGSGNFGGGLVGLNHGAINNSYAMASVNGSTQVGGLVGYNYGGTISNSYATGSVTGNNFLGGLVAYNDGGTISNSYWNTTNNTALSGLAGGSGSATGLTTQQMQDRSNFSGFNFTSTPGATGNNWVIVDKDGTLNNAGGATGATSPMLATEHATTIVNAHQLQLMAMAPSASYTLASNINAAATAGGDVWGRVSDGFTPTFAPIGNGTTPFSGTFNGLGHTISVLTINLPSQNYVGLFGQTSASTAIKNVGLVGGSVTGQTVVGGLVGFNYGTVDSSYSTGVVSGSYGVGGLVGLNHGTVSNSHANGAVSGSREVGGLVGTNYGTISNTSATGAVTGGGNTGGLTGWSAGTIENSYATGDVSGVNNVGGLVGLHYGTISDSYATGSVAGGSEVGGLVGMNNRVGSISNSYATGSVSGSQYVGGLAGYNGGTISNGYWNTTHNPSLSGVGGGESSGATGLTTPQMQTASNFAGFTFTTTPGAAGWVIVDKDGTLNNAGGAAGATSPMLATEHATTIVNLHQLQLMAMAPTASYTLGTNINAAATAGGDVWGSVSAGFAPTFAPIGNAGTRFSGTFDSLGHTITGLTVNLPSQENIGLFGVTSAASVIQNVGLLGGSVTGSNNVGGLVGWSDGTINNSYATGNVTGLANTIGGLVGMNQGTISNSYATGSVNGQYYVGGLVGLNNGGGEISKSYASGSVTGIAYLGGLVGANYGTISNSYATGSVTGSSHIGGLVGLNDGGTINNAYWNTTNNPTLSGVGAGSSSGTTGLTTQQMQTASNFAGFTFTTTPGAAGWVIVDTDGTLNNAGGATGATSPMLATEYSTSINNAHQLQLMAMDPTASYTLASNINAAATAGGDVWGRVSDGFVPSFAPVGNATTPFAGTFDGLGHTISNLKINLPSQTNVGLFGKTSAASVIQNVGLVGGSVTGDTNVGGLVGFNYGGTISNSYASGSATNSGYYLGGLVGRNNSGTISNSYTTGNVNGNWYVGALVGGNYGVGSTISNSYATGSISGSFAAGGLVGWSNGSINYSHATGNVTGDNLVGGLVGRNLGTISNSYATGSVTNTDRYYAGGLVGYNDGGTINNSYASGTVSGTGSYVGGLVGRNGGGAISTSYWNTTNNPLLTAGGGGDTSGATGLTTQQMQTASNFAGFSFTTTPGAAGWVIVDTDGTLNNASGTGATSPMLASEYSTSIVNAHQLQLIAMAPAASYALGANINAAATAGGDVWGAVSAGFVPTFAPVGNGTTPFSGAFDGLGHTISGLAINLPSQENVGLFGSTSAGSVIQNVGLVGGSVSGQADVGGLVGYNVGTVSNSYATGSVNGHIIAGGLVGNNSNGTISNSYATGNVIGSDYYVGGLVGNNSNGTISNSYATGSVSSSQYVGGLVGNNSNGTISNSYATGPVSGSRNSVGGLLGYNSGTVSGSFATTGSVTGYSKVGGLVGSNANAINNSYATGSVTGSNSQVGGLVGANYGSISNSYATGSATGSVSAGGLVGQNVGSINHSYWNTTNNPLLSAGVGGGSTSGATGLTSAQMMKASSFADWSLSKTSGSGDIWRIYEGHTAPLLTSFLKPLTLSDAPDASGTYNGSAQSGDTTANGLVLGTAATGTNAGFYNGYYSTQQGYDITGGNLTITGAALSAISLSGTRPYDGTRDVAASIFTLSGLVGSEDLALTGVGTISSKNVGTYNSVSLGTLTLGNGSTGLASNYTFAGGTQTVIISKADLSVSGLSASNKVYNALRNATLTGTASVTALLSDVVTLDGTAVGTFADKTVGNSKAVTVTGVTLAASTLSNDNANYNLLQQTGLTANITKADLNVTGLSATGRVYNALRSATLTGTASVTALLTDVVTLGGTAVGTFATKDVGINKAVTVTGKTLSGTDAGNYNLIQPTGLTATITKANLNVSGLSASGKVYDGLTTAMLTGTARVTALGSDVVTLGGTAVGTFASKDVGLRAVTVTGKTLSGTDAGNYNLVQQTGLSATITPLTLLQQLLDLLKKSAKPR